MTDTPKIVHTSLPQARKGARKKFDRPILKLRCELKGGERAERIRAERYMRRRVPEIFLTHDNHVGDYIGNTETRAGFAGRKGLLAVRGPRDGAVQDTRLCQKPRERRPDGRTDGVIPAPWPRRFPPARVLAR